MYFQTFGKLKHPNKEISHFRFWNDYRYFLEKTCRNIIQFCPVWELVRQKDSARPNNGLLEIWAKKATGESKVIFVLYKNKNHLDYRNSNKWQDNTFVDIFISCGTELPD